MAVGSVSENLLKVLRKWSTTGFNGRAGSPFKPASRLMAWTLTNTSPHKVEVPLIVIGLVVIVGCWLLVVGCWLLVVGCWLLVVGSW